MVFMIFFLFICSTQKKRGCPFVRYSIPQAKLLCHKNRQNLVNFAQIGLWILFRSSLPRRFAGRAVFVLGFSCIPARQNFIKKLFFCLSTLFFQVSPPAFVS
ncbi:MAG: hypothetical protein ACLTVY_09775 [Faecalibacterium sp.]|jgi:hypothetical protein